MIIYYMLGGLSCILRQLRAWRSTWRKVRSSQLGGWMGLVVGWLTKWFSGWGALFLIICYSLWVYSFKSFSIWTKLRKCWKGGLFLGHFSISLEKHRLWKGWRILNIYIYIFKNWSKYNWASLLSKENYTKWIRPHKTVHRYHLLKLGLSSSHC